jgi:hypothetical protein
MYSFSFFSPIDIILNKYYTSIIFQFKEYSMKKLFVLVLVVLSISCQLPYEVIDNVALTFLGDQELYDSPEFDNLTSPELIGDYFYNNGYTYKADSLQNTQGPEETFTLRTGDCEDYSILMMNILYQATGGKAELVMVTNPKEVITGGISDHVIIRLDGVLYSGQSGREVEYEMDYKYSFSQIFPNAP